MIISQTLFISLDREKVKEGLSESVNDHNKEIDEIENEEEKNL